MKTVSRSIPREAQTTRLSPSITYTTQAVVSRPFDILPEEPFAVKANKLTDRFQDDSAVVSDIEWVSKFIVDAVISPLSSD